MGRSHSNLSQAIADIISESLDDTLCNAVSDYMSTVQFGSELDSKVDDVVNEKISEALDDQDLSDKIDSDKVLEYIDIEAMVQDVLDNKMHEQIEEYLGWCRHMISDRLDRLEMAQKSTIYHRVVGWATLKLGALKRKIGALFGKR